MKPTPLISILASCVFFLIFNPAYAQDFKIITESKTFIHSKLALSADQKRSLRRFRRDGLFFGAFYAEENGDGYAWVTNRHTLRDAQIYASEICKSVVPEGVSCILHATIQSDGLSQTPDGPVSMSSGLAEFASDIVPDFEELSSGYVALSASRSGSWGVSEIKSSEADAVAQAVDFCKPGAIEARAEDSDKLRLVLERIGFYDCVVAAIASAE